MKEKILIQHASPKHSAFVKDLFTENQKALKCDDISLSQWEEILSLFDPDEEHFLICISSVPVGYMKINGLMSPNEGWISMLFVANAFKRQGVGTFAIQQAEQYFRARGFKSMAIQTDLDNFPAKSCYLKYGFYIFEESTKIKFRKMLQQ